MKRLSLTSALVMLLSTFPLLRAQAQNILTLRFDTITLTPGQHDVFLNATYSLRATKPHDFRGYEARFFFDSTFLRIVDIITDGTASSTLFTIKNPAPPRGIVIADGDQEVDLKNPVLFTLRLNANSFLSDTTRIRWDPSPDTGTRIPSFDNIDSVVFIDGWIRVPHPTVDVVLSSAKDTVSSDSTFLLPLNITDLSNANISHARITLRYDSSVLHINGATSLVAEDSVVSVTAKPTDSVTIDVLPKKGKLFLSCGSGFVQLMAKASKRSDTVTTTFRSASFTVLNSDALVGKVGIRLDSIRVVGQPKPINAVVTPSEPRFAVYPNPSSGWVKIKTNSVSGVVTIADCIGREIWKSIGNDLKWDVTNVPAGSYFVTVVSGNASEVRLVAVHH